MRREEADLMRDWVRDLHLPPGTICLNIGSSTKTFRERDQPHISERFIQPLETDGLKFIHCDMKQADGVDEAGDVFDAQFRARLRAYQADLLICSNLLEHLTEPQRFADACGELLVNGGFGLFSVPLSYPYHPDPIDTMLRLTPKQLAAMMPNWSVVRSTEIAAGGYWRDLRESGAAWSRLLRQIARVVMPFYRPHQWRANASRVLWLARTYRVSVVLLQKPSGVNG
jgi:SAM-dependent methyltransferase